MGLIVDTKDLKLPSITTTGIIENPLFFCLAEPSSLIEYASWGATRYQIGTAFQCRVPCEIVGVAYNTIAANTVAMTYRLWDYDNNVLLRTKQITHVGTGLKVVYFDTPYIVTEEELHRNFLVSWRPDAGSLNHTIYNPTPAHVTDGGSNNLYTVPRCVGDTYYLKERSKRFVNGDTLPTGFASVETWPIDPIIRTHLVPQSRPNDFIDRLNNSFVDTRWTQDKGAGSSGSISEDSTKLTISYPSGTVVDWYSPNYNCPRVYESFKIHSDWECSVFVSNVLSLYTGCAILFFDSTNANNYHRIILFNSSVSGLTVFAQTGPATTNASSVLGITYCWLKLIKLGDVLYFYYKANTFANKPTKNSDWVYLTQVTSVVPQKNTVLALIATSVNIAPGVTGYFQDFEFKALDQGTYAIEIAENNRQEWRYIDAILPALFDGSVQEYYQFDGTADSLNSRLGNSNNNLSAVGGAGVRYTVIENIKGLFFGAGDFFQSAAADISLELTGDITLELLGVFPLPTTASRLYYVIRQASGETEATNALFSVTQEATKYMGALHEYSTGLDTVVDFETNPNPNSISLVTVTRDATAKVYKMYLNGVLMSSKTYATNATGGDTGGVLTIGALASLASGCALSVLMSLRIILGAFTDAHVLDSYKRIRGLF